MKICPICKTQYSDEAEFCAKDKCVLQPIPEKNQDKKIPFNGKRLLSVILCTFGFILFMMLLYNILGNLSK